MREPARKIEPGRQIPHPGSVFGRSPMIIGRRVRSLGLCLLVLHLAASLSSAAETRLERFADRRTSYPANPGAEFPGGKTSLLWSEEGCHSTGALRVDYDFSEGGLYGQWVYSGWVPPVGTGLGFCAKGTPGAEVLVRLLDATNQWHQYRFALSTAEWEKFGVALGDPAPHEHWGGSNDGVIHVPLRSIQVGPASGLKEKGTMLIDELTMTADVSEEELARSRVDYWTRSARLDFTPSHLGGIFSAQDDKSAELSLAGVPTSIDEVFVYLDCADARGCRKDVLPGRIILTRSEGFARKLELQSPIGYYDVPHRLAIKEGEAEREIARGSFAYAVIPPNPVPDKDPDSPFGVNTHFSQGWPPETARLVKKAGIAWIRNDVNQLDDITVPIAKENRLCYMPVFTWADAYYRLPHEEKERKKEGGWDFSDYAERYRQYAAKYGNDVAAYDLLNEPHGLWGPELGGSWWGGPWQDVFVQFGRQVSDALREANPEAVIVWEDVDQLIWYKKFYDLGVRGDTFNVISPHPYNLHRENPLPEHQDMLRQLPEFHRFVQAHALPWRVWSGEVGFSTFRINEENPGLAYTPCSELVQAQWLVRMMVSQLANGVEKIFYYDFLNDRTGSDPTNWENNFGLIRTDFSPKPSLVAYSVLISKLRQARWLGEYEIGGMNTYAFVNGASEPKLVAWVKTGSARATLNVPSDVRNVTVTDIFGVSTVIDVANHQLSVELSETPLYVEGLKDADILPFLNKRDSCLPGS